MKVLSREGCVDIPNIFEIKVHSNIVLVSSSRGEKLCRSRMNVVVSVLMGGSEGMVSNTYLLRIATSALPSLQGLAILLSQIDALRYGWTLQIVVSSDTKQERWTP